MSWESKLQTTLASKRVFITGHTGFKGSWLTAWLQHYGCEITGYSLAPTTNPNLFEMANLREGLVNHCLGDVNNKDHLLQEIRKSKPELVLHLAAQSLVRYSYQEPCETWSTNVMGTVNLLEAVRSCPSVKAVVVVTTDKCYENKEWVWGYREEDPLGGYDPYSASKASAELVVSSYRKSFFYNQGPMIASSRAGNVIGGGDWSEDRLIPDVVRAIHRNQSLLIRNPEARRPWQHVLDCLQGYLLLATYLIEGERDKAIAFNFGPSPQDNITVSDLLNRLKNYWPQLKWEIEPRENVGLHEATFLYLDSSLAKQRLGWSPKWSVETALDKTISWYQEIMNDNTKSKYMIQKQLK